MPQKFANIDDVLGDAQGRYFGVGHTRVGYVLSDHRITRSAQCTATVAGSWSEKGATPMVPHVSTLDAVALSTWAAQRYLISGTQEERVEAIAAHLGLPLFTPPAEAVRQAAAVIAASREAVAQRIIEQQRPASIGTRLRLATRF
jgi:hypothetical protein